MRRSLIVMLKEPRPGRVKTRLAQDIGTVSAAWWFRHQARDLIRRLRDPRWQIVLAVTPDRAGMASRCWPGDVARVPQGGGDLGRRMRHQMAAARTGPVCVIGADIPGITRAHIWRAFGALAGQDAVFGPALDGGYWLVGMNRVRAVSPGALGGVRWSGPHALADSIASLGDARVALCDELRDVDTIGDLNALRAGKTGNICA